MRIVFIVCLAFVLGGNAVYAKTEIEPVVGVVFLDGKIDNDVQTSLEAIGLLKENKKNSKGRFIRARTRCYFRQIDPSVSCPDSAIGHAMLKVGTPQGKVCAAAKRAAYSPRGCQRKHCTPCTYDFP